MSEEKETKWNVVNTWMRKDWLEVEASLLETRCWITFLGSFGIPEENYIQFVALWKEYGMKGIELISFHKMGSGIECFLSPLAQIRQSVDLLRPRMNAQIIDHVMG